MTDAAHPGLSAADRRADALRRAAHRKRQDATSRADTAIRRLVKERQEINFRSVARAGRVSLDFLYTNPEFRRRIETLRGQQTPEPREPTVPEDPNGIIVHVLTTKLRDERAARRTAMNDLEQRLAAAHGELLRLRRILQQHNIQA